jgi:hypothetical protein
MKSAHGAVAENADDELLDRLAGCGPLLSAVQARASVELVAF